MFKKIVLCCVLCVVPVMQASHKEEKIKSESQVTLKEITPQNFDSDMLKTFAATRRVHVIADEIADEIDKKHGGWLERKWSLAERCKYQTKQGLLLYVGSWPNVLATPSGPQKMFGNGKINHYGRAIATKLFFEKMKVKFVGSHKAYSDTSNNVDYYDVTIDSEKRDAVWTKLTTEEYESAKGTDKFIIASNCECPSVYEILSLEGVELSQPKAIVKDDNGCTSKEVSTDWDTLEKLYDAGKISWEEIKKSSSSNSSTDVKKDDNSKK